MNPLIGNGTFKKTIVLTPCIWIYKWIEIKPNGDTITHELDVIIRNPDGTFNGDKALDYLNFDVVLADKMTFDSFGEYHFILKQKTGLDSAPFMVNIEIEAQELKDY